MLRWKNSTIYGFHSLFLWSVNSFLFFVRWKKVRVHTFVDFELIKDETENPLKDKAHVDKCIKEKQILDADK